MIRKIKSHIINDLNDKIVILTGPRQVGKTTLAQSLTEDYTYLNYDIAEHKKIIIKQSWPKDTELLILDELHKLANWKTFLKGIYDLNKAKNRKQKIIVTGSARLDIAKKMGDSLAGRHFLYTLNPLTPKELNFNGLSNSLEKLLSFSGFPEPFIKAKENFYRRWQISHLDIILRQDLIDLEQVKNISQIELLVELLRTKVGSPCSYSSLAEDLKVSPITVKNWLTILENLFVIFKITPYHKNIARSILKTPKYYFYDIGRVPDSGGARYENLVALSLKSEIDFLLNTEGRKLKLNYLRNKDKQEIDFLITEENEFLLALEAKKSEIRPDKSFKAFINKENLCPKNIIQLIQVDVEREEKSFGLKIETAASWLKDIDL